MSALSAKERFVEGAARRRFLQGARLGATVSAFSGALLVGQLVLAQPVPTEDAGPGTGPADVDAGVAAEGEVPWAGATDVNAAAAVPSFLDTADRRIHDDRPPPSSEQLAALREMEAEVGRFTKAGGSYRDTVVGIVRREYLRQRRARDEGYSRQIREEERLQNEARDRAITLFERFIARYPNDPTYTPDAMFRLGELYYERSAQQYQTGLDNLQAERDRRIAAGQPTDDLAEPEKDFNPTIDLYRRLIQNFPNYRRIDGVYYLIGYCLGEMDKPEEARLAWLNLVCGNHFTYRPPEPPQAEHPLVGEAAEEDAGVEPTAHPSLTLDGPEQADDDNGPFVDPYAGCTPVMANTQFFGEVWLRIGEYHFDYDFSPHGLDRAISAYGKVLSNPDDRNYNLALYKIAWSYYRASRYPEATQRFSQLVQWSDDERQRTGRAGSELRQEAIQYLAISFGYDDWNENQVPDPQEGMPTGITRVQDQNLMPQDRTWTAEVYFQLGMVYFDEAKYNDAIAVWRLALQRWPLSARAPEISNMIARAFRRNNDFENDIRTRDEFVRYSPQYCQEHPNEPCWYDTNVDHPTEQRFAEQLVENAVIATAIQHHQEAQRVRRRCVEDQDPSLCQRAQEEYRLAAEAYRSYIRRYPNNPQAYELQYSLADALYWSENYEEAAREYAAVRDSNLDDTHLSESARRVVESVKRLVDQAIAAHQLEPRTDPPATQGTPPTVTPVAMPQLLQRLAQAREVYLARVDERHDSEHVRESYDYNNALLLYQYGFWPQARARFTRIFNERCTGPNADESGQVAWANLNNMAVSLNQTDEVDRLSAELLQRQCTFSPSGTATANVDCARPENRDNPRCLATRQRLAIRFQRASETFDRAEAASGDDQRRLYEQAATDLVRAVNDEPNHPQAPLALERAAIALERTSRFESATRLYQRIIDEVGPRRAANAQEQQSLDAILSNAYFRLAFSANNNFDYDRAIQNYRALADSERFARSTDPAMRERREGALINAAKIFEYQQRYAQAAEYYRRAVETLQDPNERRAAAYRVAEMSFKQRNWTATVRDMQAFIDRYRGDVPAAGELLVQAQWRIAQARQSANQQREYKAALQSVVDMYARSGQAPGSLAAEYAAEARFRIVDNEQGTTFESFAIRPGTPATMNAYVQSITTQINAGATQAKQHAEAYNVVPGYRRPVWTIAAFVRQGRIYEVLARAVLNTPFVIPADLQATLRRATQDQREEVRIQVEDRVRQVLDGMTRPIECLAVARYALAARAARQGSLDNEWTRTAIDRLQAYGDEAIATCIAQAQQQDASFGAYQPGEFTRAPRGRDLDISPDVAPPALAPEDQ